jgi:phosphoribosylamine--glycine ligase
MKVLIVGSGGREHALAWKVSQSTHLRRLFIAPGNAGTSAHGENAGLCDDIPNLVSFAVRQALDLVIVGPEAPLAAGLADELAAAGVPVFGPSRFAARIEASKAFAKEFMTRHDIPTARFAIFEDYDAAVEHMGRVDYPLVIKASGLAAGKGVIVPQDEEEAIQALKAILLEHQFGAAGGQVVLEERLVGEEVSLLAFSDGHDVCLMPPAQDHKRLLDGDLGPNTGGMGAYAPTPLCPPQLADELKRSVIQPVIDGLRQEGHPFVGVLYAGLMLTDRGARVLEYNCRFGDPETQAILPLLESDLLDIAEACVTGRLARTNIHWKEAAAACIVLASEGYPEKYPKGRVIQRLDQRLENAVVFHAGTQMQEELVLTAGGRVLGVTGWGDDLRQALDAAYRAVGGLSFEGMQYRQDIGSRNRMCPLSSQETTSYAAAGVDIQAGSRAVS